MSIALDSGWPPSEVRAMSSIDLIAYDREIRRRNRAARRK
jgi:hypothetical protein